jgi:competence protein ComEC
MIALFLLCLGAMAGTVRVHVLDVGQGDAILIEAPGDKTVLIDAGTGKSNVTQQLQERGIKKLNLVVGSHPHADHIGGMAEVLKSFDIGMYVDNGMTHTTLTYARTTMMVEKKGIPYRAGVNDRVFNIGDEVKLTVLHPRSTLLRGTRSDLNSNSVVLRLDHKDICFLFTGDAEDPTERALLNGGLDECDVLKVAHHGSGHSTSDSFLRAVKPKFAAVSAGLKNRYKHPDEDTLARLKNAGVVVHRTDLEGTITFTSTGRKVSVNTSREAPSPKADMRPGGVANPDGAILVGAQPSLPTNEIADPGAVNINTADVAALDQLPGIGPKKAAAIVADRTQNGPFESCGDLQRVYGIGPATVKGIASQCTAQAPKETP